VNADNIIIGFFNKAAATEESTPPLSAQITFPFPTVARMSSIDFSMNEAR
jgi:hypothetical protein